MKTIFLLFITIGLLIGACGNAAPSTPPPTDPAPTAAITESGNALSEEAPESAPSAQTVANSSTETAESSAEERKKIDEMVNMINDNIKMYKEDRKTVQYQGAAYTVIQHKNKQGFVVKSEAIGGPRNWEYFALPSAQSEDQLIYGAYYQKTDDPYAPISRVFYHLGTLLDAPETVLVMDQEGETVMGEGLVEDRMAYQAALAELL